MTFCFLMSLLKPGLHARFLMSAQRAVLFAIYPSGSTTCSTKHTDRSILSKGDAILYIFPTYLNL
jgi:hypothetical protein